MHRPAFLGRVKICLGKWAADACEVNASHEAGIVHAGKHTSAGPQDRRASVTGKVHAGVIARRVHEGRRGQHAIREEPSPISSGAVSGRSPQGYRRRCRRSPLNNPPMRPVIPFEQAADGTEDAAAATSSKTPTSIYLSLQFGIRVANYPLTEEDLDDTVCLRY